MCRIDMKDLPKEIIFVLGGKVFLGVEVKLNDDLLLGVCGKLELSILFDEANIEQTDDRIWRAKKKMKKHSLKHFDNNVCFLLRAKEIHCWLPSFLSFLFFCCLICTVTGCYLYNIT